MKKTLLGVGATLSENYYIGLGYEMSLMKVSKEDEDGFGLKNKCFTLTLGYNF